MGWQHWQQSSWKKRSEFGRVNPSDGPSGRGLRGNSHGHGRDEGATRPLGARPLQKPPTTQDMNTAIKKLIPSPLELGRETIIVIGGALVAALIIGQLPMVRNWMKAQWDGSNPTV